MKRLSESLENLATHTKQFEDSAAATAAENRAQLEKRRQEIDDALDNEKSEFEAAMHGAAAAIRKPWVDAGNDWGFPGFHARAIRHTVVSKAHEREATVKPARGSDRSGARVRRRPAPPPPLHHPVVLEHAARRAGDAQLRIADRITAFAGSMPFVYLHAIAFTGWMLFVEPDPWPRLTLVVSLEAIFLSTFVMIAQNRQAEFQRAKADHDFATEVEELRTNTELTQAIHRLTSDVHRHVVGTAPPDDSSGPGPLS